MPASLLPPTLKSLVANIFLDGNGNLEISSSGLYNNSKLKPLYSNGNEAINSASDNWFVSKSELSPDAFKAAVNTPVTLLVTLSISPWDTPEPS